MIKAMTTSLGEGSEAQLLLRELKSFPEKYWIDRGQKMALELFHQMAKRVPAYQNFLKKNGVNAQTIQTVDDFKCVPPVCKQNYLNKYPLNEVCWDGKFKNSDSWTIASTSGSTGDPFYFPRHSIQDDQYALTAEMFLRSNFEIHKKSTLFIVAFPLGVWIGGLFTYEALSRVASHGYHLNIITPGINKLEVIKAVKNIGKDFDQVIIGSYAPFLKDIIDDGINAGIKWSNHKLGFVFAAEGFSETFRDYVAKKTKLRDIYKDTLNIYGTVDLGTMAHETPLSILIRRTSTKNAGLYQQLFGQITKLPTLAQFLPEHFYFEEENGNLYCSAKSGIPLVRYDLKDHGGVFTLGSAKSVFNDQKIDLHNLINRAKIDKTVWNLPFVYVYERRDFSVSFFAFQVYPESIRKALQAKAVEDQVTGKFTMEVDYNPYGQQVLKINVELKGRQKESGRLRDQIQLLIVERLLDENSEYRKTHEEYGSRVYPKIIFWPYEDPTYFKPGTKQQWVAKS
jgi:phenylacetate-CoA ligase